MGLPSLGQYNAPHRGYDRSQECAGKCKARICESDHGFVSSISLRLQFLTLLTSISVGFPSTFLCYCSPGPKSTPGLEIGSRLQGLITTRLSAPSCCPAPPASPMCPTAHFTAGPRTGMETWSKLELARKKLSAPARRQQIRVGVLAQAFTQRGLSLTWRSGTGITPVARSAQFRSVALPTTSPTSFRNECTARIS